MELDQKKKNPTCLPFSNTRSQVGAFCASVSLVQPMSGAEPDRDELVVKRAVDRTNLVQTFLDLCVRVQP